MHETSDQSSVFFLDESSQPLPTAGMLNAGMPSTPASQTNVSIVGGSNHGEHFLSIARRVPLGMLNIS